jgi:hypothetical protein
MKTPRPVLSGLFAEWSVVSTVFIRRKPFCKNHYITECVPPKQNYTCFPSLRIGAQTS